MDENQERTDFHYSMSFMKDIVEFLKKHQQFVPLVLHDIEEIIMKTNMLEDENKELRELQEYIS